MLVVLDTNILISACWKPGGNEDRLVGLVREGKLRMAASAALWAEYEEVLRRPKFVRLSAAAEELMAALRRLAVPAPDGQPIQLARDPDDDLVMEAALWSGAQYLITGNLQDYPLQWPVARIVNARQFLEQWDQSIRAGSAAP